MRTTYALIGLGFLIIIGATYFFISTKKLETQTPTPMLTLTSSAFEKDARIPAKYTCDAESVSPPLSIANVPEGTKSLVLTLEDPDVPKQLLPSGTFDHWAVYAIPPETKEITEGQAIGNPGLNGAGKDTYVGPCPPTEYEPTEHRYFFRLYALDTVLTFVKQPTKADLLSAMQGHVIESAELMARYDRAR
jgi:Raf kinase inhibitor-like YbhB/YbcL family protein